MLLIDFVKWREAVKRNRRKFWPGLALVCRIFETAHCFGSIRVVKRFDRAGDRLNGCRVFWWKSGKIDGVSAEPAEPLRQIPVRASSVSRATLVPQSFPIRGTGSSSVISVQQSVRAPWKLPVTSGGEQLRFDILEGLEFQGVATGIEEKHRGLFSRLSLKADVGFDDEFDALFLQAIRQGLPAVHRQYDAEMRNGNAVTVDGVDVCGDASCRTNGWIQVADDLVTEEIEVDPGLVAAAFTATEQVAIKGPGLGDVTHLKGEVKGSKWHRKPQLLENEGMKIGDRYLACRYCDDKESVNTERTGPY